MHRTYERHRQCMEILMMPCPQGRKGSSAPLSGILSAWFSSAKTWWGFGLSAQVLACMLGATFVLMDRVSALGALVAGVVSVLGGAAVWRSEFLRQRAELQLRLLEFADGF